MIEITFTGRMGKEEFDAQFDEATREAVGVSIQKNSPIPGEIKARGYDVEWTLKGCWLHPDDPAFVCRWLRSHGYQTNQQEEDWLDHATNVVP